MNISILGVDGVGKTTLLESIKENISPELDFSFFDEKPLSEDIKAKTLFGYIKLYEDLIESQMRIKKWGETNNKNFISVGSPILSIAYMIIGRYETYNYSFHDYVTVTFEMLRHLSYIVNYSTKDFHDYDPLFYIPIEFESDDVSKEELTFRSNVNIMLKSLLKQFKIEYYTIKGTVDERTDFVLKTIEDTIGETK